MRFLLVLVILGLMIYAVIDCVRSEGTRRMVGPTWAWVALILVFPVIGALVWLAVSRSIAAGPDPVRAAGPRAPDDDPEFLRYLQERSRKPSTPGDDGGAPGEGSSGDGAGDGDEDDPSRRGENGGPSAW